MKHDEIIELLSLTVNKLDSHREFGTGDVVMMIINTLKEEWKV